jgi:hypothetical protein
LGFTTAQPNLQQGAIAPTQLNGLVLPETQVTDLSPLSALTQLNGLFLSETQVTDVLSLKGTGQVVSGATASRGCNRALLEAVVLASKTTDDRAIRYVFSVVVRESVTRNPWSGV